MLILQFKETIMNNIDLWSYFAGQALSGLLSKYVLVHSDEASQMAADHADAMMIESEKRRLMNEENTLDIQNSCPHPETWPLCEPFISIRYSDFHPTTRKCPICKLEVDLIHRELE